MGKHKIGILNPYFLLENKYEDFNAYSNSFLEKYCEAIVITDIRLFLRLILKFPLNLSRINKTIILKKSRIRDFSVLISFNGYPNTKAGILRPISKLYNNIRFLMPKFPSVLNVIHTMDFFDNLEEKKILFESGRHDVYLCYYGLSAYLLENIEHSDYNKLPIIEVPFGFSKRFRCLKSYETRDAKAVLLGSVKQSIFMEDSPMHLIRDFVNQNKGDFEGEVDIFLSENRSHLFSYDIVEMFNKYKYFINDASSYNFAPSKTFEGIACGAVMIAEDLDLYKNLGFVDGKNCILITVGDYQQIIEKILFYNSNPSILNLIHLESLKLSQQFSHECIADNLFKSIITLKGL